VQSELKTVWSLFQSRGVPAEEAGDPAKELFVPVEAETGRFEALPEAREAALEMMEREAWEVGVLLVPASNPEPWQICWLEPASPSERRKVVAGELAGYEWVRARPPRRELEHALHELRQFWLEDDGRRAYAVEEEMLSSADLTRTILEFRERRIF
jgi:hypothetical protein